MGRFAGTHRPTTFAHADSGRVFFFLVALMAFVICFWLCGVCKPQLCVCVCVCLVAPPGIPLACTRALGAAITVVSTKRRKWERLPPINNGTSGGS